MSLREQGADAFGALVDQHVDMAQTFAAHVCADPRLELMAPVAINIVCFRYRGRGGSEDDLRALNTEIMLRIQESGVAVPTDTTLNGRHSLRAAYSKHLGNTSNIGRCQHNIIALALRRWHHHKDFCYTRHMSRHRIHDYRARICSLTAWYINTNPI